jgi:electron transport complex protein RnfB
MDDVYERLAQFLDELPAGYPRTESGVELRILRKLFTPEEAELLMHMNLIGEEAPVIAYLANRPVEEVRRQLEEMEQKGLIYASHRPGKPAEYVAQQFVVGFWEGQVNRLDRELVEEFEAYFPYFMDPELWRKAPQMRTIPISASIPVQAEAMPYERAEEIIRAQSAISLANCICRQERHIHGEGCNKPIETCLSFGSAAYSYVRNGRGRMITQDEALEVLKLANEAGLVLQPTNSQDPMAICACCGCCCGILRSLKMHPNPGTFVSSPYIVSLDVEICSGCEVCVERCQMGALTMVDSVAALDEGRCIGCGLCVSTCDTGALVLTRKPEAEQPVVPMDTMRATLQLGQARGKLGKRELVEMMAQSKANRQKAAQENLDI